MLYACSDETTQYMPTSTAPLVPALPRLVYVGVPLVAQTFDVPLLPGAAESVPSSLRTAAKSSSEGHVVTAVGPVDAVLPIPIPIAVRSAAPIERLVTDHAIARSYCIFTAPDHVTVIEDPEASAVGIPCAEQIVVMAALERSRYLYFGRMR